MATTINQGESGGGSWTTARTLTMLGAGGVAVGAFLPWISASLLGTSRTITGIDADGTITLGAAAVVGIAVALQWSTATQLLSIVGGLVPAGLGGLYINDPAAGVDLPELGKEILRESASIEIGLYLTAAAGVLMLVAGALGLLSD